MASFGSSLLLLLAILCCLSIVSAQLGSRQRFVIKGRLRCGDEPATGIRVKLIDEDDGPDPDDDMDDGYTDANGEFRLDGEQTEVTPIDPVLKVYHDCNDGLPCQRKWRFKLPMKYITKSGEDVKVMNMGTWNLEAIGDDEERDCIH